MSLKDDRFYLGDVPGFLAIIKLLTKDTEFCVAFDHAHNRIDLQAIMLAGAVGTGVRLCKHPGGIIVPSGCKRSDRCVLRVDSMALLRALVCLGKCQYAYMALWVNDNDIHIDAYTSEHDAAGSAVVHTLTVEDSDGDFSIVDGSMPALAYPVTVTQCANEWKRYMGAKGEMGILFDHRHGRLCWTTRETLSRVVVHMPIREPSGHDQDIQLCLLPAVLEILRNVLQVAGGNPLAVSLSDDLPLKMRAQLDDSGSFMLVYAGTKDE